MFHPRMRYAPTNEKYFPSFVPTKKLTQNLSTLYFESLSIIRHRYHPQLSLSFHPGLAQAIKLPYSFLAPRQNTHRQMGLQSAF